MNDLLINNIPVLLLFKDYGRNGICCQLVNKSTPWNQSMTKSVKFAKNFPYVVQSLSESCFEPHMVYVPPGECDLLNIIFLSSNNHSGHLSAASCTQSNQTRLMNVADVGSSGDIFGLQALTMYGLRISMTNGGSLVYGCMLD